MSNCPVAAEHDNPLLYCTICGWTSDKLKKVASGVVTPKEADDE